MRPFAVRPFALGRLLVALSSWFALLSCASYEEALIRGQRAFEQSEHERALAILRALEPDAPRLSIVGRAHYAYLRGMTDYRIGYRSEARHWLALAAAMDQQTPGALSPDWEKRLGESLKELNEEVYTGGMESLFRPQSTMSNGGDSEEADAAPDPSPAN